MVSEQEVKDHRKRVIKKEVWWHNKNCPRCLKKPPGFKRHDARQRQFRLVVERLVRIVLSMLVRMKCPLCGKTFTVYPPFAVRHKRFVKQDIMQRTTAYLQMPAITYQQAAAKREPEPSNKRAFAHQPMPIYYPPPQERRENPIQQEGQDNEAQDKLQDDKPPEPTLAPSTVHRWISSLASMKKTVQNATSLLLDKGSAIHRQEVDIPARKYRSEQRKNILQDALRLIYADAAYRVSFGASIFPDLATSSGWQ